MMSKHIGRLLVVLAFAGWTGSATAIPITNTVTVDGNEWAQPVDFNSLSWNTINMVCPLGVCSGTLNGYDMDGWTWASVDGVDNLFNWFLGIAGLGGNDLLVGPDLALHDGYDSTWAPMFCATFDCFEFETLHAFVGLTSTLKDATRVYYGAAFDYLTVSGDDNWDQFETFQTTTLDYSDNVVGGWFYRAEQTTTVPIPSTLVLLGLGLFGLRVSRQRAI
jgi:hypothetical protein